jgi:ParB family transcriptional regulator, chromosome partitioning protein
MKSPDKPNVLSFNRPGSQLSEVKLSELRPSIESVSSSSGAKDLEAHVSSASSDANNSTVQMISVEDVLFGKFQPRILTNENDLEELSASIRSHGMLQPILVRQIESGDEVIYEAIAGERRLRAARLAGLAEIPAIVRQYSDREALEVAIVENAQREDLNPIEEAFAYQRLSDDFGLTQKEISEKVGKNRSTITNSLRLLQLDVEVLELVKNNQLSAGHGRALLMLEDLHEQKRFAAIAVNSGLSVHVLEKLIQKELGRSQEEEDVLDDAQIKNLKKQGIKIAEYLGIERAELKVDSKGQKRLNLVFPSEASWKRFVARVKA